MRLYNTEIPGSLHIGPESGPCGASPGSLCRRLRWTAAAGTVFCRAGGCHRGSRRVHASVSVRLLFQEAGVCRDLAFQSPLTGLVPSRLWGCGTRRDGSLTVPSRRFGFLVSPCFPACSSRIAGVSLSFLKERRPSRLLPRCAQRPGSSRSGRRSRCLSSVHLMAVTGLSRCVREWGVGGCLLAHCRELELS